MLPYAELVFKTSLYNYDVGLFVLAINIIYFAFLMIAEKFKFETYCTGNSAIRALVTI